MLKNYILLWLWQVLTLFPVKAGRIRQNTEANARILGGAGAAGTPEAGNTGGTVDVLGGPEGGYIEDQPRLGGLLFGSKYDFAYGGCSVIAVYNAMVSLGEQVSKQTLLTITEELQRRGVALGGKFGVAPLSLKRYLRRKGYAVRSLAGTNVAAINALGDESDTILAVVRNGRRLRDQLHAINIEKRGDGYIIHNNSYLIVGLDGKSEYAGQGPFGTLAEALSLNGQGRVMSVLVIGIRKQ